MDPLLYRDIALNEERRWWDRGRRAILARFLRSFIQPGKRPAMLSAGCGTGGELRFLSRYGRVTGIDNHEEALAFCRAASFGDAVVQGSIESLPFKDGSFDFVFALDVLEHLPDDRPALCEIKRVLRVDGIAFITVPAFQWLWSHADEREHHSRRYRRRELEALIRDAGLEPIRVTYYNTILFLPIAAAKLISRLYEPKALATSEVHLPGLINELSSYLFGLEARLLPRVNFPFGISILAIARRC